MITFKADFRSAIKRLDKIAKGYEDFKIPLKQSEAYQLKQVQRNFATEGKTIANGWAKLKRSTIRDRIRKGYGAGPILKRTGKLKNSIARKSLTKDRLAVGSNVTYFKYHQIGTGKMSKRQILGHSAQMKMKVLSLFSRYVRRLLTQ